MPAVPVKKAEQQTSQEPILTFEEYLDMRRQMDPIKDREYSHFRKILATTSPRQPEDVFDVFERVMSMSEKLNRNNSSPVGIFEAILSVIRALSQLDKQSIGEVLKKIGKIGEALAPESSGQSSQS